MVLPWPLLLIGSAGVSAGGAIALNKLFNRQRCSEEFFGKCDTECAYGEDPNTCIECLYTCGVPEEEHPFFFQTLFTRPPAAEDVDVDIDVDIDEGDDDDNEERRQRRGGRKRLFEVDKDELQDELDEMSRADARSHVGGGGASMTQDTRGLRAVHLA